MITVLGSINIDLIVNAVRLPAPGETIAGTAFSMAAGGKGANQALAAARAGRRVRMAGATGIDTFAEPALALLGAAGIDLGSVRKTTSPTGSALITVSSDGENTIVVVAGANGDVSEAEAEAALAPMQTGDILMLQLEIPAATVGHALMLARQRGIATVLNLAPFTPEAARLARLSDIVIANETEFALLSGATFSADALLRQHDASGQTLVVTLGADGVMAARNGVLAHAKGLNIVPVDTVGAGDTFSGYLAAGLDAGLTFQEALQRAAAAGSLACLKHGAQPSIPTGAEVDAALA